MLKPLKRVFGPLYFLGNLTVCLHALYEAAGARSDLGFWGAALATFPGVVFFFRSTVLKQLARTSPALLSLLAGSCAGIALTAVLSQGAPLPWIYAVGVGLIGSQLYTRWYSVLGRPDRSGPRVGAPLPEFEFSDHRGEQITTAALRGQPLLLLFYRGSWCPFCTTQIRELAASYRELAARGVKVICLSPQPAAETQALAERFDVPMTFGHDKDGQVGRKLGIWHTQGIPFGVAPAFGADTVYPTVLLVDSDGKIIFADLTDNYRLRPEPSTFMNIIDAQPSHDAPSASPTSP